jgi:hypothetical protein
MTARMQHVHIVGSSPRSGTTLLAEMMAHGFRVHAEPKEVPIYSRPAVPVDVYLTKRPWDVLVSRFALRALPNVDIVCMVRDPRDVVVSVHGEDPDRYWAGLKFWKTYEPEVERLHGRDHFTIVRYENLVRDPDGEQRKLMTRLPYLDQQSWFSTFDATARPSQQSLHALRGLRPVSPASIGAWRSHLPRLAGQLEQHGSISDSLVRHGYERDASWEAVLVGVEPDVRASHWPEHYDKRALAWRRCKAMVRTAQLGASEQRRRLNGRREASNDAPPSSGNHD